jgi:hypothetical protein
MARGAIWRRWADRRDVLGDRRAEPDLRDPVLQSAFNQFHAAVHVGPANTAFDHTHYKVDISATGC